MHYRLRCRSTSMEKLEASPASNHTTGDKMGNACIEGGGEFDTLHRRLSLVYDGAKLLTRAMGRTRSPGMQKNGGL